MKTKLKFLIIADSNIFHKTKKLTLLITSFQIQVNSITLNVCEK